MAVVTKDAANKAKAEKSQKPAKERKPRQPKVVTEDAIAKMLGECGKLSRTYKGGDEATKKRARTLTLDLYNLVRADIRGFYRQPGDIREDGSIVRTIGEKVDAAENTPQAETKQPKSKKGGKSKKAA